MTVEETDTIRWGIRAPGWDEVRHIPEGRHHALDQAIGVAERDRIKVTVYIDNGSGWSPLATYQPSQL